MDKHREADEAHRPEDPTRDDREHLLGRRRHTDRVPDSDRCQQSHQMTHEDPEDAHMEEVEPQRSCMLFFCRWG